MLSQEMVARIERAENDAFLTLYRAAADAYGTGWCEVDGIYAVWSPRDDDPGYSCVLNLAGAADPRATLARIEERARTGGATVLGIDGSPAVLARIADAELQELGYVQDWPEAMQGRVIAPDDDFAPDARVRIERAGPPDRDIFARVLNVGYDLPADAVRGHVYASTIDQPGWYHYLVSFDGEPGSASVLYITERVAQLFVATTMPVYRGRGAQTALIRRRLADAQAAGCDLATSQTVTDNASPRNMARHDFQELYVRWIYGKALTRDEG
jgi:hypothetical protein